MKITLVALVLAVSLFSTADAWYYGGWGYWPYYSWGYPYFGGYWWGKRDNSTAMMPVTVRTECSYNKETLMLACHGKTGQQECKAEMEWPKSVNYELYGIELVAGSTVPASKWHLIPRELDNSGWKKHSIVEAGGVEKFFTLFEVSEMGEDYGIGVKDTDCYGKITELLKLSPRNEKIFLESEVNDKQPEEARIIAELVIFEKLPTTETEKSKRWWGGMWGAGMWGYPWGGVISPFGLWGKRGTSEEMKPVRDVSMEKMLSKVKRVVETGFEMADENTKSLAMEINKLKREINMLKLNSKKQED
jgi:hypothetical protein